MTYAIRCTPHYFVGDIYGRDKEYLVQGFPPFSDEKTIVLGTVEDAETLCKVLRHWADATRHLDNGQYAAPEYRVEQYRGKVLAITLAEAAWALGYGFNESGDPLTTAELQRKIKEMVNVL